MKIAVFGASGMIGQRIVDEAARRGHQVMAIARNLPEGSAQRPGVDFEAGNILDPDIVALLAEDHDVVINAFGPGSGDPNLVVKAAHSVIEGLERTGVKRLVVVGGAGSLEVSPGVQLVDAPDFPEAWKGIAIAHRDALEVYRQSGLDWTYVSPPALIAPGERTGHYRRGGDELLVGADGQSRISAEDYAIAIIDEAESPRFVRKRFTVGYW
jgi:putative NADH-flavin reductase